MICSYCETESSKVTDECSFCGAPLKKQRPQMKEFLYVEQCELPFQELSLLHTFDLLVLLRLVRHERSKSYNLMRGVQKGSEWVKIDADTIAFGEEEYRRYTARMKVIEGLLVDRMGYKPRRVDDKLLNSLKMRIERGKDN